MKAQLSRHLKVGSRVAAMVLACGMAACASQPPARSYQSETFSGETPFQYYSSRQPENACEIARRALLSQGYQVEESKSSQVRGEKYFRPGPDDANKLTITLVCLPSNLGTAIYASALETMFQMKAKGASAGVSVSSLGSVSLPWAIDKDTLVKVGEETITAPGFYQRLFDLIKSLDE